MGMRLKAGNVIPAFCYDTPYEPQKSFYELTAGEKPVMMIFLRNFGHPLTRHYIMKYLDSAQALTNLRLVCVVQSQPQTIAAAVSQSELPFELICDADGVLYDYFEIPKSASRLRCYSLDAIKIIRQAQKEGYVPSKNELHQLPLTLVVGNEGKVLFAHYGRSLTDLPSDCYAMERVAEELGLVQQADVDWMESAVEEPKEMDEIPFEGKKEEIASEEAVLASLTEDGLEVPVVPMEQPVEPQSPQKIGPVAVSVDEQPTQEFDRALYMEKLVAISAAEAHRNSGLPRGKVHYPEKRKRKALDFSELGFGREK